MFAYTTAAGSPSEERVKLLGSLATTRSESSTAGNPRGLKAQQDRRQEKHMIEARQPTGKGPPNDSPAASSDSHPGARTAWHVHALSQTLHVTGRYWARPSPRR